MVSVPAMGGVWLGTPKLLEPEWKTAGAPFTSLPCRGKFCGERGRGCRFLKGKKKCQHRKHTSSHYLFSCFSEYRAHQSVLGVDGREGTMLTLMGGVSQHTRIMRLNHGPSRTPRIRRCVMAFCHPDVRQKKEQEGQRVKNTEENNGGNMWEISHYFIQAWFNSQHLSSTEY